MDFHARRPKDAYQFPSPDPNTKDLPDKVIGKHRWIVVALYSVTADSLKAASRGEQAVLDHENIIHILAGCYDCEEEYPAPEPCKAGDMWSIRNVK